MTTAADARRIVALDDALAAFADVNKAARSDSPRDGYTRLVLNIGIESTSESGSEAHAFLELDIETARLLLPAIRKLIKEELGKLGAEP